MIALGAAKPKRCGSRQGIGGLEDMNEDIQTSFDYAPAQLFKGERKFQVLDVEFAVLAINPANGDICANRRSTRYVTVCGGRGRASGG